MDIQRVNSTLVKAIESMHSSELAMLWEFAVPTPHEMHRKHGMRLPKGTLTVPTPGELTAKGKKPKRKRKAKAPAAPPREVSQSEAEAGAAKTESELHKVFDRLKPKQVIWVSYQSTMGGIGHQAWNPVTVGRRGRSKKYNTTTITLLYQGQKKPGPSGMQPKLMRRDGENVRIMLGDMAARLRGIYVP